MSDFLSSYQLLESYDHVISVTLGRIFFWSGTYFHQSSLTSVNVVAPHGTVGTRFELDGTFVDEVVVNAAADLAVSVIIEVLTSFLRCHFLLTIEAFSSRLEYQHEIRNKFVNNTK